MNGVELAKTTLQMSEDWLMGLVADMQDEPLARSTPGGNHTMWILGHLAHSEGNLINQLVKGEPNPAESWGEMFGQGSSPSDDASGYPTFDEVMEKMNEIRISTKALLDSMTDEDLSKPSNAPEEMKAFFGTVGQCFAALPVHFAFHVGQVADARRAVGRKPLMG